MASRTHRLRELERQLLRVATEPPEEDGPRKLIGFESPTCRDRRYARRGLVAFEYGLYVNSEKATEAAQRNIFASLRAVPYRSFVYDEARYPLFDVRRDVSEYRQSRDRVPLERYWLSLSLLYDFAYKTLGLSALNDLIEGYERYARKTV